MIWTLLGLEARQRSLSRRLGLGARSGCGGGSQSMGVMLGFPLGGGGGSQIIGVMVWV